MALPAVDRVRALPATAIPARRWLAPVRLALLSCPPDASPQHPVALAHCAPRNARFNAKPSRLKKKN
jgi:hypothetical protein